jgi:hypothetical protein
MSEIVVATIAGPASVTVASGILVSSGGGGGGGGAPDAHASTHATAGSDPVSPSSIGALSVGEGIAYAIALG